MTAPLPTLPCPSAAECCAPAIGLDPRLDAGLVRVERRHKWAYYVLNADAFTELSTWLS